MRPAEFYTGIVPDVYTVLRSMHFSTERYRSFVQSSGAPALELGCGDSSPFYDLAAEGMDIEGVDSSPDMVRRGRERLAADGAEAPVRLQRMEELTLERRFASIYLAGPTFNLLPDDPTAQQALHAIHRHLLPGGSALVPLWTPPPTPDEEIGVTRSAQSGSADVRLTVLREQYDAARRTRTTELKYELITAAQSTVEHREWVIHWYEPEGFRELAANAGMGVTYTDVDEQQMEATLQPLASTVGLANFS